MSDYLRRHAESLDDAVALMRAANLLGGHANLYDMLATNRPHWLVNIYDMYKPNDWTDDEEDKCF
jgi:CO/xanthine dehydrogenase FAD-binding subunit